jgi:hypothetical protein
VSATFRTSSRTSLFAGRTARSSSRLTSTPSRVGV